MSLQNDFMHFWQFEIWRRCCLMRLADKTVKTISTISKQILAFKGLLYFFACKCWLHVSLFNVFCCLFSHKMLPFLKNETVQSLFRNKTTGGCFECQYPTAKKASLNLTTSKQQSGVHREMCKSKSLFLTSASILFLSFPFMLFPNCPVAVSRELSYLKNHLFSHLFVKVSKVGFSGCSLFHKQYRVFLLAKNSNNGLTGLTYLPKITPRVHREPIREVR